MVLCILTFAFLDNRHKTKDSELNWSKCSQNSVCS
jgi:hypothetical protein